MSRFDSLTNMENAGSDSSIKSTSIFQDNYRYARVCLGKDHTSARNFAIDYHRQHTSREMTDFWDDQKHTFEDENAVSQFDLVAFNQLVFKLWAASDVQGRQFLFSILRQQDLEQHLSQENLQRLDESIGDFSPEKMSEVVKFMQLPARANGSSGRIPALRKELAKLASSLWLDPQGA